MDTCKAMMAFAVDEEINSRGDRGDFVYCEIKYLLETVNKKLIIIKLCYSI